MASIFHVVVFSLAGGLLSLIGGFLMLTSKVKVERFAYYATPFAAGALLAAAFIDLLPEAIHQGVPGRALTGALLGLLFFFVLEQFLNWFHHHHEHEEDHMDPNISLVVIGDTVHNAIDGIVIASAFLVNVPTGIIATLAVAAHEIPQEIGDFGLLLKKGMSNKGVILTNLLSAMATMVTAVIFFYGGEALNLPLDLVLGAVAGFFIYIATSDIIPTIHKTDSRSIAWLQTSLLFLGVLVVAVATTTLHSVIEEAVHGEETTQIQEIEDHESAHEHEPENLHSH